MCLSFVKRGFDGNSSCIVLALAECNRALIDLLSVFFVALYIMTDYANFFLCTLSPT